MLEAGAAQPTPKEIVVFFSAPTAYILQKQARAEVLTDDRKSKGCGS
jgi:hypothetical protein